MGTGQPREMRWDRSAPLLSWEDPVKECQHPVVSQPQRGRVVPLLSSPLRLRVVTVGRVEMRE